jgi:hypothetical protein
MGFLHLPLLIISIYALSLPRLNMHPRQSSMLGWDDHCFTQSAVTRRMK